MTSLEKQIIAIVLDSLRNSPQDWETSHFEAKSKSLRAEVWVANSYYGVEIRIPGIRIGGVTGPSVLLGRWIPWRRKIYRAAKAIQEGRDLKVVRDWVLAHR